MVIRLQEGERKVEVEGNDELIKESLPYQGTFERVVKEVTDKFYKAEPQGGGNSGSTKETT